VNVKGGTRLDADHQLAGGPSIFFDAVVVAPSDNGAADLEHDAAAIDWIRDAFGHLKVIGVLEPGRRLFARAGLEADGGVIALSGAKDIAAFITAAKNGRVWEREPSVRPPL
jgi:catalase